MPRLFMLLKNLRGELATLWFVYRDPRTPRFYKALLLLAIFYIISPVDVLPDAFPVAGWLDDASLIPLLAFIVRRARPNLYVESAQKAQVAEHSFSKFLKILGFLGILWVVFLMWVIWRLVH